jgi:hypothetical protein
MMSYRKLLKDFVFNKSHISYLRNAEDYLATQLDEEIPAAISNFINKLLAKVEMEEKDFKSFHHELSLIKDNKVYNTLVYSINTIGSDIFHSYETEIKDSVEQIKAKIPVDEKIKPHKDVGLLNVYLINRGELLNLRNLDNKDGYKFPYPKYGDEDIFEYHIPLSINALRLTNKLPKEGQYCSLDLSKHLYPKKHGGTTEEIPLRRGTKNKNEYVPFYKNSKLFKGTVEDTTYLATNGKKFLFIRGRSNATSPDSVMAAKIATFVSKKHFSSERRLTNQLIASKQLPGYKIPSVGDKNSRDEKRKIIQEEKRIYSGTGIINEVLNFIHETDHHNSENYGFSDSVSSPESFLCKIDFDHCDVTKPLPKKYYEQNCIAILYYSLPHVYLDPTFIQEMLYTRLKLSLLTTELNNGFAQKASDDKDAQKQLTTEATARANIAFELFLENKNSAEFLTKNANILNTILQESVDYARKHFDEPMLSQIHHSLQVRFKEIHNKIATKLNIKLPPMKLEKEHKKLPEKVEMLKQAEPMSVDITQKIKLYPETPSDPKEKGEKNDPQKSWWNYFTSFYTLPTEPSSITFFLEEKGSLVLKFSNEKDSHFFTKDVKGTIPATYRIGPQFAENKNGETPIRLNESCLSCPAYKSKSDDLSINLGSQAVRDAFIKKLNINKISKKTHKNGEIGITYLDAKNSPVFTIYNNSKQNTAIYFNKSLFTKENEYITIKNGEISLGTDTLEASFRKKP